MLRPKYFKVAIPRSESIKLFDNFWKLPNCFSAFAWAAFPRIIINITINGYIISRIIAERRSKKPAATRTITGTIIIVRVFEKISLMY